MSDIEKIADLAQWYKQATTQMTVSKRLAHDIGQYLTELVELKKEKQSVPAPFDI